MVRCADNSGLIKACIIGFLPNYNRYGNAKAGRLVRRPLRVWA